jgi:hypothetical protein
MKTPHIRHADPILRMIDKPGCVTPDQMRITRQELIDALMPMPRKGRPGR